MGMLWVFDLFEDCESAPGAQYPHRCPFAPKIPLHLQQLTGPGANPGVANSRDVTTVVRT